jgi:hypothetical protein
MAFSWSRFYSGPAIVVSMNSHRLVYSLVEGVLFFRVLVLPKLGVRTFKLFGEDGFMIGIELTALRDQRSMKGE